MTVIILHGVIPWRHVEVYTPYCSEFIVFLKAFPDKLATPPPPHPPPLIYSGFHTKYDTVVTFHLILYVLATQEGSSQAKVQEHTKQ